jgi:hypothetical protein
VEAADARRGRQGDWEDGDDEGYEQQYYDDVPEGYANANQGFQPEYM